MMLSGAKTRQEIVQIKVRRIKTAGRHSVSRLCTIFAMLRL